MRGLALITLAAAAAVPLRAAAEVTKIGTWTIEDGAALLDGAYSFSAETPSTNEVASITGRPDHAHLIARCDGGDVAIYVTWPGLLGFHGVPVAYRFDTGKIVRGYWSTSSDGTAAGTWHNLPSRTLGPMILRSSSFIVQFKPYGSTAQEAAFDLTGSPEVIQRLQGACPRSKMLAPP